VREFSRRHGLRKSVEIEQCVVVKPSSHFSSLDDERPLVIVLAAKLFNELIELYEIIVCMLSHEVDSAVTRKMFELDAAHSDLIQCWLCNIVYS
jgi:hypothetical protein